MVVDAGEVWILVAIRAVNWVVQPLVEVTGRLAEGVVLSGYALVEPGAVWVAGSCCVWWGC